MILNDYKKIKGFTLVELIIILIIISIFLSITLTSREAYLKLVERKEVDSIVHFLDDALRQSANSSTSADVQILADMQTISVRFFKDSSKKIKKISNGLKFVKCSRHKLKYTLNKTMAPSLGGVFHLSGVYKDYDIIFPPVIARFRVNVKDKNSSTCR